MLKIYSSPNTTRILRWDQLTHEEQLEFQYDRAPTHAFARHNGSVYDLDLFSVLPREHDLAYSGEWQYWCPNDDSQSSGMLLAVVADYRVLLGMFSK